ncbi:sulfite exporter TauE/SafE family protein [uncultured Dysgonomonas sp.]|uniref:sulfite exporter TauE/SafE family protein n=1 Tax=uncultured Dysgonomonas sp. TaxID=206096 RepID=UPI002606B94E|nr:sulfite exporter TauE/SafE family protein [uncultured Dysgonomonas sp.]
MNIYTFLILVVIGLLAGTFGGVLGISGAIIIVPCLVFLVGLSQHEAIGTSLAFALPPIGLLAMNNYYKAGQVNFTYAIILALAFIVGSYFSSKVATNIPEITIKKIFSIFLVVVAIKMFFSK